MRFIKDAGYALAVLGLSMAVGYVLGTCITGLAYILLLLGRLPG